MFPKLRKNYKSDETTWNKIYKNITSEAINMKALHTFLDAAFNEISKLPTPEFLGDSTFSRVYKLVKRMRNTVAAHDK